MTSQQLAAFERGKHLIREYKALSPKHAEPIVNGSTVAGDMIADIQFTLSTMFDYPAGDVESARIAALNSLQHPRG